VAVLRNANAAIGNLSHTVLFGCIPQLWIGIFAEEPRRVAEVAEQWGKECPAEKMKCGKVRMKALDRNTSNLLRAIVRPQVDGCEETIAELVKKITCWENTIEGALQHGVLPSLYFRLAANRAAVLPEALELARIEFERNAFHCLANAAELLEVLNAFKEAGIAAMPFKGVVLGASAYGDMMARTAGDLDVLIYYRDLQRATQILSERGYKLTTEVLEDGSPKMENYFEYHFERADDGMVLELRWRLELTQPRYRHDLGMDWAWPRRKTIKLAGADVPSMDAVSGLLMLCMHGSKHGWSRLVWICDVAKLLESEPGLDWEFVQREAKRVGLTRCLALGVLLARNLVDAPVPAEVLRRLEAERSMRKLTNFLQANAVEQPGRIPDGRVPINIQLLGFQDRAAVILSPTFLRPNAQDRAVVKLPKALDPLYYLIRPLRLLLARSGR
jgi:Uncharacterised nucleotidyltransferase